MRPLLAAALLATGCARVCERRELTSYEFGYRMGLGHGGARCAMDRLKGALDATQDNTDHNARLRAEEPGKIIDGRIKR